MKRELETISYVWGTFAVILGIGLYTILKHDKHIKEKRKELEVLTRQQ